MAAPPSQIRAWHPQVDGVIEVLHAYFPDHAYPVHTHDTWTLLLVDEGIVTYDLDGREHGTMDRTVTVLPPHVPHDGKPATSIGFRKRVLYLDEDQLSQDLIGRAVDRPTLHDTVLRKRIGQLHAVLAQGGEELEAQSRLALVVDRLQQRLSGRPDSARRPDPGLARRLRELLDANVADGVALDEAAGVLGAHPTHLVRAFRRHYGVPPHRYLTGRRVDRARHLLLEGVRPAEVAATVGFYDQAHLTRHFRRILGMTPARFAASGSRY